MLHKKKGTTILSINMPYRSVLQIIVQFKYFSRHHLAHEISKCLNKLGIRILSQDFFGFLIFKKKNPHCFTALLRKHSWNMGLVSPPIYRGTCVKGPLSKRQKIGFQDQLSLNAGHKYCRMLQGEHSAILPTCIKLPFVIKIFVLSIFEWPFYTGFTAEHCFCTYPTYIISPLVSVVE